MTTSTVGHHSARLRVLQSLMAAGAAIAMLVFVDGVGSTETAPAPGSAHLSNLADASDDQAQQQEQQALQQNLQSQQMAQEQNDEAEQEFLQGMQQAQMDEQQAQIDEQEANN